MYKLLLLFILLAATPMHAREKSERIERAVRRIIRGKQATVGVAVLFGDNQAASVNNDEPYPALSVFKYPVAFAALHALQRKGSPPDSLLYVSPQQLLPDTYSPLRDKYPGGHIRISYAEAVRYTVSLSDNNTCDLLIELAGGIDSVAALVAGLGIAPFHLSETEQSMHADTAKCRNNWFTPLAMAHLLKTTYTKKKLDKPYSDVLEQAMLATSTGTDKIRAGLPSHAAFGHKTGSSDRTAQGVKTADNDAGVITLPDGTACYIAVFIKDSKETDAANARIAADIGRVVYRILSEPNGRNSSAP